jgi:hypothetical protein
MKPVLSPSSGAIARRGPRRRILFVGEAVTLAHVVRGRWCWPGRSQLVICNGGSLATQQALAAGVPVLGVVSNLDPHLNMLCLERAGVGQRPRVGRLTAEPVRTAARRLLDDAGCHEAAGRLRSVIGQWDTGQIFAARIAEHDGSGSTAQI